MFKHLLRSTKRLSGVHDPIVVSDLKLEWSGVRVIDVYWTQIRYYRVICVIVLYCTVLYSIVLSSLAL